uniref:Uncharacterized protein n=1 Tax=Escherichia coli TaxID=562 RepID=A0A7R7EE12_ECOLX|nr:hypothetical protein [Escherichia coli]BCN22735.1 hypothetical protein [Escherichia coli]
MLIALALFKHRRGRHHLTGTAHRKTFIGTVENLRIIGGVNQRNAKPTSRTTAAWRLQIVVWQNMSFQSNHPE